MYVICNVDVDMLEVQIADLLQSNIRESSKDCLHHFLGEIKDKAEKRQLGEFPLLLLNKEFLYKLFEKNPKRVAQIERITSHDMDTLTLMVSRRLAQSQYENIKEQIIDLFEHYYTFPYEEEAKIAVDSLDNLLNYGPLKGDDIEQLVEQFKLELQDRHGDIG